MEGRMVLDTMVLKEAKLIKTDIRVVVKAMAHTLVEMVPIVEALMVDRTPTRTTRTPMAVAQVMPALTTAEEAMAPTTVMTAIPITLARTMVRLTAALPAEAPISLLLTADPMMVFLTAIAPALATTVMFPGLTILPCQLARTAIHMDLHRKHRAPAKGQAPQVAVNKHPGPRTLPRCRLLAMAQIRPIKPQAPLHHTQ